MTTSRCALLRWHFDFVWSLLEFHLDRLYPDDHLWEPADRCWSVRPDPDGAWIPDWEVPEPDPAPVPTIAWLTWHIGWWWSVVLDHQCGRPPRDRSAVSWPGSGNAAVGWLRDLRREWIEVLDGTTENDLDAVAPFPWHNGESGRSVAHMLGWVNAELMKNAAEIGQLRMVRAAGTL